MIIFSILAFLTLFISIYVKDRKVSLKVQSINCTFEALYAFSIKAYTGAILGVINFIRSSLFVRKEKFSKIFYLILLVIFECVVVTNCIFTWNGIISLFPTIGSIIKTYCLWQTNMQYIRMSSIVSGTLFGIYYIYYQSWFMAIGYLTLFIISLYSVYTMDLKGQTHGNTKLYK